MNLYTSVLVLNPLYSVLLGITLISFLIREKPSLVILHNGLPGLISSIICRLAHKQVIFSEGNLTPWTEPYLHPVRKSLPQRLILKINKRIGKTIAHLSNCVRAQSLSIKTGMVNAGIPEGKIVVIEGGVDVDSFHPVSPPRPLKDSVNAAFIGRLMEEKGVKILIDIVHIAQTELPNLRFYIFGDGQYRNSFGGCSNIEHLGPVLKSELNVWLDKVDIVLFFQKDLGLAELESLAAGKTILVCNVGEIPKIIHHGQNGILCNPQPRAYIDAIRYLLENPSTTDIISENARITAVEQFSWSVIIDKWMKLIKNCKGRNIQ